MAQHKRSVSAPGRLIKSTNSSTLSATHEATNEHASNERFPHAATAHGPAADDQPTRLTAFVPNETQQSSAGGPTVSVPHSSTTSSAKQATGKTDHAAAVTTTADEDTQTERFDASEPKASSKIRQMQLSTAGIPTSYNPSSSTTVSAQQAPSKIDDASAITTTIDKIKRTERHDASEPKESSALSDILQSIAEHPLSHDVHNSTTNNANEAAGTTGNASGTTITAGKGKQPERRDASKPTTSSATSSKKTSDASKKATPVFASFEEEQAYVIANIAPPDGDLLTPSEGSGLEKAPKPSRFDPLTRSNVHAHNKKWTKDWPRRNAEGESAMEPLELPEYVAPEWRNNPWPAIISEDSWPGEAPEPKSHFSWSSSSDGEAEGAASPEPEEDFGMSPAGGAAAAAPAHDVGSSPSSSSASRPAGPSASRRGRRRPLAVSRRQRREAREATGDDPRLSTAFVDPSTQLLRQRMLREEAALALVDEARRSRSPASSVPVWGTGRRRRALRAQAAREAAEEEAAWETVEEGEEEEEYMGW